MEVAISLKVVGRGHGERFDGSFFHLNEEKVVQNRKSGNMTQTTINDAYKTEASKRASTLITRWMYEAVVLFYAITYPCFQPMIEAIGQYGVGMMGPRLH